MPQFSYKVRNASSQEVKGTIEAPDLRTATDRLKSQKMVIVEVNEIQLNPIVKFWNKINPFKPTVGSKDLVLFSRQLSTLVSAGVPIVQGLSLLVDQASTPLFKNVLLGVKEDIEQGISINDAMRKHPEAFTELYVSMVKAGEIGGILDAILDRLSAYLESAEELKGKVKGAMVYPAVIGGIAGCITLFLMIFIIPTFQNIFAQFGGELPLPTRVMIWISEFLRNYILLILATPVVLFVGIKKFAATPKGQLLLDTYALKLPVFGILLTKVAVAKFSRTLGTLIKSGVPILQALDTVGKTSGNKVIENAIETARQSIKEGERMAPPLQRTNVFPAMVVQMISIGEETGNLDIMLSKIADFYDQEVDAAVKGLTSMIEPVVMVIMGVVVGAIVLSMFMPMFEMGQMASK